MVCVCRVCVFWCVCVSAYIIRIRFSSPFLDCIIRWKFCVRKFIASRRKVNFTYCLNIEVTDKEQGNKMDEAEKKNVERWI